MIELVYGNGSEALLDALAERLEAARAAGASPLVPVHVVVPNALVERQVELGLAARRGVSAHLRFHRLEAFIRQQLAGAAEQDVHVLGRHGYERRVLDALHDPAFLARPEHAEVRAYLGAAGAGSAGMERRRVQLAQRLGRLFEGYGRSRPELVLAWAEGRSGLPEDATEDLRATERWQRALFLRATGEAAPAAAGRPGARPLALPMLVGRALDRLLAGGVIPGVPAAAHVLGFAHVAPVAQHAFAALGAALDLTLYVRNPCRQFWEDLPAPRALARFATLATAEGAALDPVGLSARRGGARILAGWGRPAREHVRLVGELTGARFEDRFVTPEGDALLARVQRAVLDADPGAAAPGNDAAPFDDAAPIDDEAPVDGSLRFWACPGVRREVETVAEGLWAALRASPDLRFHEIAVLFPAAARDAYLPHIASVFAEAQAIPHHVVDLPLAHESRLLELALRLVELPLGGLRRPELLAVLTHPCLAVPGERGAPETRDAWVRLTERLGVFHGSRAEDHAGTYLEGGPPRVHWDQAVRRVVLGAFLGDGEDADARVDLGGRALLPEPAPAEALAPAYALLVRSLTSDARFARHARLSGAAWARFFARLFEVHLHARDEREEAVRRRCLALAEDLAAEDLLSPDAHPLGYVTVATLLRDRLSDLRGRRGEVLADGVFVGSLAPMRALPFRHVFVLGLGEGDYPAADRPDPLDLRRVRRRLGDVRPNERDALVLLETLLATRDALTLSWVARDPLTGDDVAPSPLVETLLDVLERDFGAPREKLRARFPLRRHAARVQALAPARLEAAARALGDVARRRAGRSLAPAELRALGRDDATLARLLALPPIPEAPPDAREDDVLTLRVGVLRRFLEAPLQGWARAVLGIADEEERGLESREDEPFVAAPRESAEALRRAFADGLQRRERPTARYAEETARLAERGRWPLGVLASQRARADEAVLDGWRRLYAHGYRAPRGAPAAERVRFGPSLSGAAGRGGVVANTGAVATGAIDTVLPPLRLLVAVPGGTRTVELVGATELLLRARSTSLVLVPKRAPAGAALASERLRYGLRTFFDHLLLSAAEVPRGVLEAAGAEGVAHHGALLFGGAPATDAALRLAPLPPHRARAYLAGLIADLLGHSHAYFLPCEAVFRVARSWTALTPAALAQAIEVVRRGDGGVGRFGPVDAPESYAAPEDALEMARRRFGLYFALAGLDAGAPMESAS